MSKRRKGGTRSTAAVLLSKADYRAFVKASADIQVAVCAARDLVLQLQELTNGKRKRSDAARRANETRKAAGDVAELGDGQVEDKQP